MSEGDVGFAVHAEVVEDPRHPVVDAQLVLARKQQKCGRGGERLGERGQVEDGVLVERRDVGLDAAVAEGAMVDDLAFLVDEEHRPREHAAPDRILHRALDLTEASS